jgi:hypothetical protein
MRVESLPKRGFVKESCDHAFDENKAETGRERIGCRLTKEDFFQD